MRNVIPKLIPKKRDDQTQSVDLIGFHYNGHDVPRPTENGEIWVFSENMDQVGFHNASVIPSIYYIHAFKSLHYSSLRYRIRDYTTFYGFKSF